MPKLSLLLLNKITGTCPAFGTQCRRLKVALSATRPFCFAKTATFPAAVLSCIFGDLARAAEFNSACDRDNKRGAPFGTPLLLVRSPGLEPG